MEIRLTEKEWYEKCIHEGTLFDISWSTFKELLDLFMEAGYNLRDKEDFKLIKRNYFKKVEK